MITIISATNRPNSNTKKIADAYYQLLENQPIETKMLSLEVLNSDPQFMNIYGPKSEKFQQLLAEFITPAERFVIVVPEYNGSFPGILKLFIDAIPPDLNKGKKAALVGVANGRAGNLRGIDHLTSVLHYIGIFVLPNKLPISSVSTLLNEKDEVKDAPTLTAMNKQLEEFLKWK